MTNESNLIDFDFLITQKSNRLFFCDGSNDNIINDIVPLTQGVNKCTINNSNLIIDFEPNPCGGIYLKWLNNYGGYSYWLFSDYYQKNNQYKNIGELKRDFENLENTFAPTTQLGKKTNQSIDFVVDNINEMELSVIETLLESPKVFLYKGQPFSRGAAKDWIEVRVDTSKATIRNFKGQPVKIGFSLELPEKENITL